MPNRRSLKKHRSLKPLFLLLVIPIAALGYSYLSDPVQEKPRWHPEGGGWILYETESIYGTVRVVNKSFLPDRTFGDQFLTLQVNEQVQCSTYKTDMTTTTLLASIPISAHPNPRSALNIGDGCGTTTEILGNHVRIADALEINEKVIEARGQFFHSTGDNVNLMNSDARFYFRSMESRYDIITSQPSNPWLPFSSHLYTLEFYQQMRDHLTPDGVVAQWVPTFALDDEAFKTFYATFDEVFPYNYGFMMEVIVLDQPEYSQMILIGAIHPVTFNHQERVAEELRRIELGNLNDIQIFNHLEMSGFARGAPLNTDDRPILEFMTENYGPEGRERNELGILDAIKRHKERNV